MNQNLKCLCFILLLSTTTVVAQNAILKKANKSFERFDYSNAAELYEKAIAKGYDEQLAYINLADAHYMNANYPEAAAWYKKLAEKDDSALDKEHIHRYALALKSIGDYDASDQWMFKLASYDDVRADNFQKKKDYINKINEMSGRFKIENMNINSVGSDFAPSFHLEALVFSSARDSNIAKQEIHGWNKKRFLNLYTASDSFRENLASVQKFSDKLNTRAHESSTAFTKDGNTVYFTRNNTKNNSYSRDDEGVSRLKIYKSTFKNGKWGKVVSLPFNNKNYSVAHPSLNANEDKLYFASDMPGTLGKSDIWVVDIKGDNSYGKPRNLGELINTEGKETFPFITKENVLYFSSDGHPGLGGLDVFATRLEKEPYIVNVGEPINSMSDDFSFIMNTETKKGYFASDRKGGIGDDDIYAFVEKTPIRLDCYSSLSGMVKDKKTNKKVSNAKVMLIGLNDEVLSETTTDFNGNFELESDCSKSHYLVLANKDSYSEGSLSLNNGGEQNVNDLSLFLVPNIKEAKLGADLAKYLDIEPIYFDFNKSYIRKDASIILDKVVAYLKQYPNTKIAVGSHTDSRASKTYNKALSQRRAKETVAYIVAKGIDLARISGKGFGESQLTNNCADAVQCSEEKHQENRRSEFIVKE